MSQPSGYIDQEKQPHYVYCHERKQYVVSKKHPMLGVIELHHLLLDEGFTNLYADTYLLIIIINFSTMWMILLPFVVWGLIDLLNIPDTPFLLSICIYYPSF